MLLQHAEIVDLPLYLERKTAVHMVNISRLVLLFRSRLIRAFRSFVQALAGSSSHLAKLFKTLETNTLILINPNFL